MLGPFGSYWNVIRLRAAWILALGASVYILHPQGAWGTGQGGDAAPVLEREPVASDSAPGGLSVVDGVFTREQASRGERRFDQVCGQCHRTSEFSGVLFRTSWSGQTMGDLFELVATTMPEGNPGGLRPEEYAGILAFILSSNDYPAGEVELPSDLFQLDGIRIETSSQ